MARSLRLSVSISLQAYRHFFFSEGYACDICVRPRPPSMWLGSHGDYSPSAPSLRPVIPSSSLIRCDPVQVYHHQPWSRVPFQLMQAEGPSEVDVPTSLALKLLVVSSFVSEGADPCIMSYHSFFESSWKTQPCVSQPPASWFVEGPHKMSPCFPGMTAVSGFRSLCHCCTPRSSVISSQPSVLYLYDCVPYAVQVGHLSVVRTPPSLLVCFFGRSTI
jgi:hypothetical protein